ncbi:hypothetical protein Tco_0328252 [Tanacetum coccineum]
METYSCEFCGGGPHHGFDCQTGNTLVYEQVPCNNQNFGFDQYPYYSPSPPQQFCYCEDLDLKKYIDDMKLQMNEIMELIRERYKIHETPISFDELVGSDDDTEVIFDEEQFIRQQSTAHVIPLPLAYTPPPPFLATMEPLDTFLMRAEVISTTLAKENDEFIKSRVDDLVPIPKESEVTSVCNDLECSMPFDSPP